MTGFQEVEVQFVKRIGNRVAHCVAHQIVRGTSCGTWEFNHLLWLLSPPKAWVPNLMYWLRGYHLQNFGIFWLNKLIGFSFFG
ncbi:hypothetical protein RHMOL_Rhmol02G0274500 [Rhododendron molle]|uniref:Uncharacterized protein n=1 Tax=Rhododendron molle TaxID=49168 RepID=A0ACC0PXJ1_RHOML|nr:hypothetical protein RHMOL_Rhmol02G0274500 [Rhododendron molle]